LFDAVEVIGAPMRARESVASGRKVGLEAVVVALVALLGVISGIIGSLGGGMPQPFGAPGQEAPPNFPQWLQGSGLALRIGGIVLSALFTFVAWAVLSLLMQLATAIVGGSGPLSAMFAVVGVASAPTVISAVIGIPLSGAQAVVEPGGGAALALSVVSAVLGLAFFIWYAALVVIGAGHARQVGYGESTGACAISCVGILVIVIVLAIVLGVIIAVAGNAAGG
jgi:hypothetical protein